MKRSIIIINGRDNRIKDEIQARIQAANKSFYGQQNLLSSKILSHKPKVLIYKTVIQPILLYGSETWSTTNQDVTQIQVFENKVLRKIYGPVKDDATGEWRRRYNKELYQLYDSSIISNILKSNRLRWLGHVHRMKNNREPKRTFNGK